ncbi:thioredoxin domain-containing protein [Methanospirillum lacunae]|uniref:Thioredoxin domain-containing protein n=1 Tax=Methanospirillum lacunae TaxID=668570 RepID=A0A2V2MWG9_9EURY|nr:thioredoxin domain-containing protein [Methanospirillum lacunae]PWR70580.1 thioredoxin domain-containing protein [Methanospirillum lacunae]
MPNRLVYEQSPYLLQHSHNPVDWYPWGEEAQTLARERDRPIFLSIGYAACHWCHVMEKECFMDPETAGLLNKHFISIKMDREEHPEIDRIYMGVCQAMTGSGGWPLSIFLTPDLKPFYAATFVPRRSRGEIPGMLDLIPHIVRVWEERRDEVYEAGDRIFEVISQAYGKHNPESHPGVLSDQDLHSAFHNLSFTYDPKFGGFGRVPKFPSVPQLIFLMQYGMIFSNDQAIHMATGTLTAMALGGIRDQVGFGFHRYAVDRAWKIPHFEKMLSDQAMNASVFTSAWQITSDPLMRKAAGESLQYICQTLRHPDGGFASAEDADSEGGEGAFYLWKSSDLKKVLTSDEMTIAEKIWGITKDGNLPSESGIPPGNNIISWVWGKNVDGTYTIPMPVDSPVVEKIRQKLYEHRELRPRPLLDDKVLTDWNGLAIAALAYAGRVLGDAWMIRAAEEASDFLLTTIMTKERELWHQWKAGNVTIKGTAQDYICFSSGLISLFQASGKPAYLNSAVTIIQTAIDLFWDENRGGFYATRSDDPLVPVRIRDDYDGPVQSVNGLACQVLSDLALITGNEDYKKRADTLLTGMYDTITRAPQGTLSLLGMTCRQKMEIRAVITGYVDDERRIALWKVLHQKYIPGLVVVPYIPTYLSEMQRIVTESETVACDEVPAVWICAGQTCRPPIYNPKILLDLLDHITRS